MALVVVPLGSYSSCIVPGMSRTRITEDSEERREALGVGVQPGRRKKATVAQGSARARRVMRRAFNRWQRLFGLPAGSPPPPVSINPRLRRALARCLLAAGTIELRPDVAAGQHRRLLEVLCHELAHLAVYRAHGSSARLHGPQWRALMSAAGFQPVPASSMCTVLAPIRRHVHKNLPLRFEHHCPVCQMVRIARRAVPAWRCASCVSAGLPGILTVKRTGV